MKINIIGTFNTGKTTATHELLSLLKKKGFVADIIEEQARKSPFPINEGTTKDSQEWIFFSHLLREIELRSKTNIMICDTTLLNIYAYYYKKFGEHGLMETIIKEQLAADDLWFFIEKERFTNTITPDSRRSLNKDFQQEIEDILKQLLAKFGVSYQVFENAEQVANLVVARYEQS